MAKFGFLSGYKTYLVAAAALIAGFVSYAVGAEVQGFQFETLGDLLRFAVEPTLAMTLRKGIAKTVVPAISITNKS